MRQHGFTLIELIVVVVLIGILSAAVLPKMFGVSSYHTRLYYDSVLNSIQFARALAVARGELVQVVITPTDLTVYRRTQGTNCTTGTVLNPVVDPSNHATAYVRIAPKGVTVSPAIAFYFDGLGRAFQVTGTTTCPKISTQDIIVQGNFSETIRLVGETGFVKGSR